MGRDVIFKIRRTIRILNKSQVSVFVIYSKLFKFFYLLFEFEMLIKFNSKINMIFNKYFNLNPKKKFICYFVFYIYFILFYN